MHDNHAVTGPAARGVVSTGSVERTLGIDPANARAPPASPWQICGLPAEDPRRTSVESALDPTAEGTRSPIVETGFAQLADAEREVAHSGNFDSWAKESGGLVTRKRSAQARSFRAG
ncbi:hypothetical protein FMUBM48_33980 [Nocardia cyriacigeorgica]|nr:hypothetical protein FMUBM48_33980 [Nocardia cyriacigeorgica]